MAAGLGWNLSFAKEATLLGVTHNLSARIDASLKASFGFDVSGKYVLAVGREDAIEAKARCACGSSPACSVRINSSSTQLIAKLWQR